MYHPDLREEIRFLKARLLYKTKKLDEALRTNISPETQAALRQQILEIEEKISLCRTEMDAQDESENEDWSQSHRE